MQKKSSCLLLRAIRDNTVDDGEAKVPKVIRRAARDDVAKRAVDDDRRVLKRRTRVDEIILDGGEARRADALCNRITIRAARAAKHPRAMTYRASTGLRRSVDTLRPSPASSGCGACNLVRSRLAR